MSKVKYRYNSTSLSYDKIEVTLKDRILKSLSFLGAGLVIGVIIYGITYTYIDSPKEKQLKQENAQMEAQYSLLNKKLDQITSVLEDVQHRDDNIYRVIFEAEPIPSEIRTAGFGGVNRYKELEGFSNSELIIETTKKLDQLSKQLYIQSKSFDDVFKMAKKKENMLAAIPAIQPVQNEDLTRMASGYGYRMHPILKYRKFHAGMDFTAPRGTPIFATGKGTVIQADNRASGYGNHVRIEHGYGYITLYAHMSKIAVEEGDKVNRGDIIGYVGNTGLSAGPHCHYEVRKNDEPVNPVNFYFNDLTAEEYDKMLELSNTPLQSLD
ncbi:M23 family metallopeptidase [Vicingus serpentipes]|uniref:M23 family metallopeptidase n=1 Tax=Vicingus serpentipes TaxID=1926625 RepID=A0A5C6RSE4_9FLAO|nr:M23 family metallopeptidase [Vicingus serpentipes]TXB65183.1 M23 family metallopeptidase [Vicingus serpentipes]